MSIYTEEHNGKTIHIVDYTNCKSEEEMISTMEKFADYSKEAAKNGKLLTLSDITGVSAGPKFMERAKKLGGEVFDPTAEKSVILGITGLKKVLLSGYNKFARGSLKPYSSKDDAIKYLCS